MSEFVFLLVGIGIGVYFCVNKDANDAVKAIWGRIASVVKGWFRKGGLG